jgi:hypothetical protein
MLSCKSRAGQVVVFAAVSAYAGIVPRPDWTQPSSCVHFPLLGKANSERRRQRGLGPRPIRRTQMRRGPTSANRGVDSRGTQKSTTTSDRVDCRLEPKPEGDSAASPLDLLAVKPLRSSRPRPRRSWESQCVPARLQAVCDSASAGDDPARTRLSRRGPGRAATGRSRGDLSTAGRAGRSSARVAASTTSRPARR